VAKLLAEFGSQFSVFLLKQIERPQVQAFFQLLLTITDFPGYYACDQQISDVPLYFWYNLQECFLEVWEDGEYPAIVKTLVERLLGILLRLVTYPEPSEWQGWTRGNHP
jgi:hypothetical protein